MIWILISNPSSHLKVGHLMSLFFDRPTCDAVWVKQSMESKARIPKLLGGFIKIRMMELATTTQLVKERWNWDSTRFCMPSKGQSYRQGPADWDQVLVGDTLTRFLILKMPLQIGVSIGSHTFWFLKHIGLKQTPQGRTIWRTENVQGLCWQQLAKFYGKQS